MFGKCFKFLFIIVINVIADCFCGVDIPKDSCYVFSSESWDAANANTLNLEPVVFKGLAACRCSAVYNDIYGIPLSRFQINT